MGYLVFCTFDLKGATSQHYESAYSDLQKLGLKKVHKNGAGRDAVIPTTAAMGFIEGTSASTVCESMRDAVKAAFAARRFKSEIFIITGDNWAWVAGTSG